MKKIIVPVSWTKHLLPMHPIVYITTISKDGIDNGAVFATCLDTSYNPPQITFASAVKQHRIVGDSKEVVSASVQDTLSNIRDTEKFIVNVPGIEITGAIKELAFPYEWGVDEIGKAGLTKSNPSSLLMKDWIFPKIINECLAHLECMVEKGGIWRPPGSDHYLITGTVVSASYDESLGEELKEVRQKLIEKVFGQLGASEKPNTRLLGRIKVEELRDTLIFEAEKR